MCQMYIKQDGGEHVSGPGCVSPQPPVHLKIVAMVESFARGVSVVQLVKRFVKSVADFHVYLKENSRI